MEGIGCKLVAKYKSLSSVDTKALQDEITTYERKAEELEEHLIAIGDGVKRQLETAAQEHGLEGLVEAVHKLEERINGI